MVASGPTGPLPGSRSEHGSQGSLLCLHSSVFYPDTGRVRGSFEKFNNSGAGEMGQDNVLAAQAWGPGFRSPALTSKPGAAACAGRQGQGAPWWCLSALANQ